MVSGIGSIMERGVGNGVKSEPYTLGKVRGVIRFLERFRV